MHNFKESLQVDDCQCKQLKIEQWVWLDVRMTEMRDSDIWLFSIMGHSNSHNRFNLQFPFRLYKKRRHDAHMGRLLSKPALILFINQI